MQGGKKKPSVGLGDIRKEEKVKGDSPGEGGGGCLIGSGGTGGLESFLGACAQTLRGRVCAA